MVAMTTTRGNSPAAKRRFGRLTEEDRKLYESIPSVVDYVPHPDFRLRATEEQLFGPNAEMIPVQPWRHHPEAGQTDLIKPPAVPRQLSRRQETALFMRYNYARYRLAKLLSARKRRFSRERARAVVRWYRRTLENRAALTNANMALVVAMANRTRISNVEFGELVAEGNMALLRALDKFDVSRGFKFSTYACRAIQKAFGRLASKMSTYRRHFPVEFDPELERSDHPDRRHKDQRELAVEDLRRVLARNAADLSEVERAVVSARFSMSGQRRKTLEQVGRQVGLSKERVRQVQNSALAKLRIALEEAAA